ncbi:Predicted methyltransferase regulatory domain-containing protein [Duganella sp. CF402]|uniref:class I SAM-dependent methyltransferase n=1 Tax=unclassified Duganella TaxID=2636909 RepID=UPI0008B54EBE|nr:MULTISPECIES: class I SAM-dependent methyltransferase [unclassified Duganella]RZT09827.1 putative methyltransferase family protein [Duganella sp. BK701]SEL41210.1 Predicted methyltransferase regulatory domain-containing protein [Duganella sp. CF402]
MADWTGGYVADLGYTFGYYPDLNPLRSQLLLLHARQAMPKLSTACELGFGQGVSVNVHAAASTTRWYGTDFHPSQAGYAQQLASSYADGAQLYDQSFAEFCARDDLPDFDFIALHGIWSWISNENRAIIVDFVRRKLKVGGVLYISYNTLPGWTPMVPVRNLLVQHAEIMTPSGAGVASKVENAVAFARKLWATNPAYARAHPALGDKLKTIAAQDPHYVAHEYFNRDWMPMSFAEMADWLDDAKLDFATYGSAIENITETQLTPEQIALLNELPDTTFRQTVRDFMVNQQFRRDYWIKGPRELTPLDCMELMRAQRVVLCMQHDEVSLTLDSPVGKSALNPSIYRPLLELLADFRPRTLGEIEQELARPDIKLGQIHQATTVLLHKGALGLAQDHETIFRCRPRTDSLNRLLLEQARSRAEVTCLASPVLGGGFLISQLNQLLLLARNSGLREPHEWAAYVDQLLKSQGQCVLKDGVALNDPVAMLQYLNELADVFNRRQLPLLLALGIA